MNFYQVRRQIKNSSLSPVPHPLRITPGHSLSPTRARGPSGHRELADVSLERRAFELVVVESKTELNEIKFLLCYEIVLECTQILTTFFP